MKRESHGDYGSPEYRAWVAMKTRCYNPESAGYPGYGGKGVTVCDEWRTSYSKFLADMGRKPTPEHTVDRIDGSKGYSKENCRWANRSEQSRNRAMCTISFDGKTQTIGDWAKEIGLTVKTIRERRKKGLPMEDVLKPAVPPSERWSGYKFWEDSPKERERSSDGRYATSTKKPKAKRCSSHVLGPKFQQWVDEIEQGVEA